MEGWSGALEADVEEQSLHQAGEHDQRLQQSLVGFDGAGGEGRVGQHLDEGDEELVPAPRRIDLTSL